MSIDDVGLFASKMIIENELMSDKLTMNYRRFYGRTLPDIEESLNTSYFLYEILQMCPPYLSNEEINPYHKESKVIHDTFLKISQEEEDVVNEYAKISGKSLYRIPLLKSISKANDCAGVITFAIYSTGTFYAYMYKSTQSDNRWGYIRMNTKSNHVSFQIFIYYDQDQESVVVS